MEPQLAFVQTFLAGVTPFEIPMAWPKVSSYPLKITWNLDIGIISVTSEEKVKYLNHNSVLSEEVKGTNNATWMKWRPELRRKDRIRWSARNF